jgi:crotonobetainyl-CoA:carnitine CoA-transferase CaiB-like acyl-CoA transferase
LERLGLGPDVLLARNPRLIVTRVTGFGQDGPYSARPGFATLAEAMSGFAAVNGEPDGPPLLPPIALTDEVTALAAAFATMVAVHSAAATGTGQVVDVNLLESMLHLMGPLISAWRLLGYRQPRLGSGIPYSVPRGVWRTADGQWVALSTSSEGVATRVLALLGLSDDERFATNETRVAHRAAMDAAVAEWIGARPAREVIEAFHGVEAAIAPILTVPDVAEDEHITARGYVVEVDGVPMQGPIARLSATPGLVRWAGRPLGADNEAVLGGLKLGGLKDV